MQEVPISVAVRVRPLVGQEKVHHEEQCISFVDGKPQLILGRNRGFKFDHVFRPGDAQDQVYKDCVEKLVFGCMDGYNATVFAYGQTGSGKTYTMGTGNLGGLLDDELGIIPRAIKDIFQIMQDKKEEVLYRVKVSFIEIYKEEAKDLLEFEGTSKDLHIREDEKGNTILSGIREETVHSPEDVLVFLDSGAALRHTASTQMNEYSSRSHCIFTIMIEQHPMLKEESGTEITESDSTVTSAKFHFVDLAGSERAHRTGNQGERFRESISINSGLLALGNVISALADSRRRQQHVPYRQSKLTRLLKDSLGGNSRTVMITCLSPCSLDFDENLTSLKYATRAKNIKNKPVVNTIVETAKLAQMQNEIQVLRDELLRQRTMPMSTHDAENFEGTIKDQKLREEVQRLKNRCHIFENISHEAASLIRLFHGSDMPPYDIQGRLAEWIDRWEELNGVQQESGLGSMFVGKLENDIVRKLQSELAKYKNDLQNDEEIFVEKTKQSEELIRQMEELEEEKTKLEFELKKYVDEDKQKDQQLFEQQLKLLAYEDQLTQSQTEMISGAPSSTRKHAPKSAPPLRGRREASILSRFKTRFGSFEEDQVMKNFRARNELLVSKYEDVDEVSHDEFDSLEDEESDFERKHRSNEGSRKKKSGLGSTFTKQIPRFQTAPNINSNSARDKSTIKRSQTRQEIPRFTGGSISSRSSSSTPSKLPVRRIPSSQNDVAEQTIQKTENTKRKLRNVELDLRDAKQKMTSLQANIKQKEELVKELLKSDKEKQELNKQYKTKVEAMEKEIEQSKQELEEAKSKLDNHERQGSEKQKLEKEYKRKTKILEGKVSALQKKQNDANMMNDFKDKGERKIGDLEGHVERLRNQYEIISRKLKDESDRKTKLEQDLAKGEQKIKELELKTDQQSKLLKRKNEEVVAVHRKLRTGSNAAEKEERNELEEKRRNIDTEIEKIVQQKQEMNEIQEELRKREEIIMKKELLLNEKYELEMKKLRSSQILSKDVMRLSVQLDDVQKALSDAKRASVIAKDKVKFQEEIGKLLRRKAEVDQQRKDLENKLEEDDVLEPAEERRLEELMEAVEALDMAIEYKNEVIEGKERNLGEKMGSENGVGKLLENLSDMSKDDITGLLQKYFERVIELKESERRTVELKEEIEMELYEKEKSIQELQHCLNQTEARAERRLIEMEKEHEKQVQFLVEKMNEDVRNQPSADSVRSLEKKIQELEKDLFYYKKTSRELKHRLREMTGSSTATVADSMTSEKNPITRTFSDKNRDGQGVQNEEKKTTHLTRVGSPESQIGRVASNENFHLPPAQRVAQEEKRMKNEQRDGMRSSKPQRQNFDRHVTQDEQRRLKEIFEARQQTSKAKKDHKHLRSDVSADQKPTSSNNSSYAKDSGELGKNPWT